MKTGLAILVIMSLFNLTQASAKNPAHCPYRKAARLTANTNPPGKSIQVNSTRPAGAKKGIR